MKRKGNICQWRGIDEEEQATDTNNSTFTTEELKLRDIEQAITESGRLVRQSRFVLAVSFGMPQRSKLCNHKIKLNFTLIYLQSRICSLHLDCVTTNPAISA